MSKRFRIHPSIGVARVGNAPEAHFIGPEQPDVPGNWGDNAFHSFRDEVGRIKRQAARFRVFEYTKDEQGRFGVAKEVTVGGEVAEIEWRVHIANRKASFFTFNGQSGAEDAYGDRSGRAAAEPETDDETPKANRRNPDIPDADRRRLLDIDPGEKLISTSNPSPVFLTNPNPDVRFIPDLGELRLDEAGRLLVLGGRGNSGSTQNPPVPIDDYANNDTWFDDVGDGSVKARVRFNDGSFVDADAAWVLVGPPDFAPGIGNVVSLYDVLWDIAVRELEVPADDALFSQGVLSDLVRQKQVWASSGSRSLDGYRPSFVREIHPVLHRAFLARWVFDPGEMDRSSFHVAMMNWDLLGTADADDTTRDARDLREHVFWRIRNPVSSELDWEGMPRGLGDDYGALETEEPRPTSLFALTRIQYALLEQWANGNFIADWPGIEPPIPAAGEDVTPHGLDRAALKNAVGGPFYPGIDVSWLIRRPELYAEPFRLAVSSPPGGSPAAPPRRIGALEFIPGFFSQQMALPWQADFYDCHKEYKETPDNRRHFYMWWTAHRPDDVFPPGSDEQVRWVRAFDAATGSETLDASPERFNQMLQNWAQLRFIVRANDRFEEEPS